MVRPLSEAGAALESGLGPLSRGRCDGLRKLGDWDPERCPVWGRCAGRQRPQLETEMQSHPHIRVQRSWECVRSLRDSMRMEEDHNWMVAAHIQEAGREGAQREPQGPKGVLSSLPVILACLCFAFHLWTSQRTLWLWPLLQLELVLTREIVWIRCSCFERLKAEDTHLVLPMPGVCEFEIHLKSCKLNKSKKNLLL